MLVLLLMGMHDHDHDDEAVGSQDAYCLFHFYPGYGPAVQGQNTVLTLPNPNAFLIGATE
jgi:hypothetical protein